MEDELSIVITRVENIDEETLKGYHKRSVNLPKRAEQSTVEFIDRPCRRDTQEKRREEFHTW